MLNNTEKKMILKALALIEPTQENRKKLEEIEIEYVKNKEVSTELWGLIHQAYIECTTEYDFE